MMNLYSYHFEENDLRIREKIDKINNLLSTHEEEVANPILEYIYNRDDLRLIGKNKIKDKNRAPTISFVSKVKSSKEVSEILIREKIATRNDNFYAWRCLNALGIDTTDGLIRLSLTHYNSQEESEKAIEALKKI